MREVGLGRLRVVLDRADATAVGDADDDGHAERPAGAEVHLGHLGDDLVEPRVDETVELDLTDRSVSTQRQADGRADDAGLGQGRVDDPVLAEVLLQTVGHAEHATELADVLAHDEDLGVTLHRLAQAEVECLAERNGAHAWCPPSNDAE